jgi:hypothetical protein
MLIFYLPFYPDEEIFFDYEQIEPKYNNMLMKVDCVEIV